MGRLKTTFPIVFLLSAVLCISAHAATDEQRSIAIEKQREAILKKLEAFGGFEKINASLLPFREAVMARVDAHEGHRSEMAVGRMIYNSEICKAAIMDAWSNPHVETGRGHNPLESIIDIGRELAEIGVDLIVVPVPSKIEAYPEEFEVSLADGMPVSLARKRFMLALIGAGIEVIDVLPEIQLRKAQGEYPLYETEYHHHSGLGAVYAGDAVASRLKRYTFTGADVARFSMQEVDTHERHHPDVPMKAWEVLYDDSPYNHVDGSPVVVIGDSNSFAHGRASWTSHIARALGLPVTEVARPGGGPYAHVRLAELGKANLQQRKVVVWLMTSSHIQRHRWGIADIQATPTMMGLLFSGRIDEAAALFESTPADERGELKLSESDANTFGYRYLEADDIERALKTFWLAVKAFPNSYNAHDSLGEACERIGAKEAALASYLESYRLNPIRPEAKERLENLDLPYTLPELYTAPKEILADYTGDFRWGRVIFEIRENEDGLTLQQRGRSRKYNMIAVAEDVFVDDGGSRLEFHRCEQNRVVGLTAHAGITLEFKRIEEAQDDAEDR